MGSVCSATLRLSCNLYTYFNIDGLLRFNLLKSTPTPIHSIPPSSPLQSTPIPTLTPTPTPTPIHSNPHFNPIQVTPFLLPSPPLVVHLFRSHGLASPQVQHRSSDQAVPSRRATRDRAAFSAPLLPSVSRPEIRERKN